MEVPFVALEQALADPAYQTKETYAKPFGVSWLHRWAETRGMKSRVAEEPAAPPAVEAQYKHLAGK